MDADGRVGAAMGRPLLTVVTPTWQRKTLLLETIKHVREQTYRNLEHVIVGDGQDAELARVMSHFAGGVPVHYMALARNWSGLMPDSFGIAPLTVGYLMADGEYIAPWCDDERALAPDHLERLVDLLETTGADFAYPRVRIWRNGAPDGPETAVIGTDPPAYCQITHYVFRASCLWRFGMPQWGTHPVDWSLIDQWMRAGATWAMLDDVTFSHRLDR